MSDDDPLLTATEAAALWNIQPTTWRRYVRQGYAPPPDVVYGRTPCWRVSTVRDYPRPGQGRRTDIWERAAAERAEREARR